MNETIDLARKLLGLIEWLSARLETLHRDSEDSFTRQVVHPLIRACDPETNPRLQRTLRELEQRSSEAAQQRNGTRRRRDRQRARRERRRKHGCRRWPERRK